MKNTGTDSNNNFRFFVPFTDIYKAVDEEGNTKVDKDGNEIMEIEGLASTNTEDSDGEYLDYNGFILDDFNFINWNHNKTPGAYIGEPVDWHIKPNEGLWIKGKLFPDQPMAKEAWQLGKALENSERGNKLGFSIEGSVLQRDPANAKKILKAKVNAVAVCPHPKNGDTFVDFITKGHTSNEEWQYEEIKDTQKSEENNITNKYNEDANGGNERYLIDIVDDNGRRIMVDDNYHISIVDKAFSAEGASQGGITTMEHIDGEEIKDKDKKKKNKKLAKSKNEVYDYIFNQFPDLKIEKAKSLYKLVNSMSNKDEGNLTEEEIQKAFENIKALANNSSEDIAEKGGHSSVAYQDQNNMDRHKTEGDSPSDGGQVTDLMNKAIDSIKDYMKNEYEKSDIFKKMKDEGYDDETIDKAFEKAAASYTDEKASKSEGGDIEKSYDDQISELENKLDELKKAKEKQETDIDNNNGDTMEKSQVDELKKSFGETIKEQVEPLTKSVNDQQEKLNQFEKSVSDIQERLEQIEQQPAGGPKSVVSKSYQTAGKDDDTVEKGGGAQQSNNQRTNIHIDNISERNYLAKALNDTVDWKDPEQFSKQDEHFLKSVGKFESSGSIEPDVLQKANEMGFEIIRSQNT